MRMRRLLSDTWIQSVPPAVAGGCMRSELRCTHPLPQVVLTVPKLRSVKKLSFPNSHTARVAGFPNKSIDPLLTARLIPPVFCHTCSPASSVEREQQVRHLPHTLPIHRN